MKWKNLTGKKFGRLTVIKEAGTTQDRRKLWECICECGNITIVRSQTLLNGSTKSCGCLRKELASTRNKIINTVHGKSYTRIYKIWGGMKSRCLCKNNNSYKLYGGRGIKICAEWECSFIAFYYWAISSGYKDYLSIDRINDNGDYEPNNCRWANRTTQQNNMRSNHLITFHGDTLTLSEWARKINIPYSTILNRAFRSWSVERMLTTPLRPYSPAAKGR